MFVKGWVLLRVCWYACAQMMGSAWSQLREADTADPTFQMTLAGTLFATVRVCVCVCVYVCMCVCVRVCVCVCVCV